MSEPGNSRLILFAAALLISRPAAPTDPAELVGILEKPAWESLVFEHYGLLGSVTTRLERRSPVARGADSRSAYFEGGDNLPATRVAQLQVQTSIRPAVGAPIEFQSRLWFDSRSALPLFLVRKRLGGNGYEKRYRFEAEGVHRSRSEPGGDTEDDLPPAGSRPGDDSFYPFPEWVDDCPRVIESSQLIPLLTLPGESEIPAPRILCVFDRKRVYVITLQIQGRERIEVDYWLRSGSLRTRVASAVDTFRVSLSSQTPAGEKPATSPFTLLGLREELQLWLAIPNAVPVRVRGHLPGAGVTELDLKELTECSLTCSRNQVDVP